MYLYPKAKNLADLARPCYITWKDKDDSIHSIPSPSTKSAHSRTTHLGHGLIGHHGPFWFDGILNDGWLLCPWGRIGRRKCRCRSQSQQYCHWSHHIAIVSCFCCCVLDRRPIQVARVWEKVQCRSMVLASSLDEMGTAKWVSCLLEASQSNIICYDLRQRPRDRSFVVNPIPTTTVVRFGRTLSRPISLQPSLAN